MDAVRRSRFASKQMRAGPAPLASFEDLPSDELESPEDYSHLKTNALDDESASRDLQFATPDSLTVSSQSTPRIESDFDSHFTLTPGGDSYQGQSTSELRTASLSSLSKEDQTLNVKQKKGSAVSLGILETNEVEYTHRKSSWTDIFKSHNQSSAKTSSASSQIGLNEKTLQKKSKTDHYKKETTPEKKSKDKGKFLSIFKKKSNKLTNSPVSSDNYILPNESSNISECLGDLPEGVVATKINNVKVSKGKENESPIDKERNQMSSEIQNDLGKVNSDRSSKIPDERRLSRKVINIPEKVVDNEYNIVSQQIEQKNVEKLSKVNNIQTVVDEHPVEEDKSADKLPKSENITSSVDEEDTINENKDDKDDSESPECELTTESVDATIEKKDDDFEAETLLSQDLSEMDEEPVVDLHPVTIEVSKQLIIPSKQQRLEVTTKPIDRPRSTTPINVASLEAFIQSVSPTFDGRVEKIKLSLPGEQFVGRVKSPKKSSLKSWTDFCERGLHSPRMHKKFDKDSLKNPFESSDGAIIPDNAQFSSENWAAFDSSFNVVKSNIFEDSFSTDFQAAETSPKEQSKTSFESSYQYFESDFSCSTISSGCPSCSNSFGPNDAQSSDQSVFSTLCEDCSCQCHSKQKSNVKASEHSSSVSPFGASEILSLVSDEQF